MKKIKNLTYLFLLSLLVSSCGKSGKNISFYYFSDTDNFINDLSSTLNVKFSSEFNVKENYADNTQVTQNNQLVYDLDSFDPNLLIVNIVDRTAAKTFIEKAYKKEIPVIFINREPLKHDILKFKNVYYVGTDPIFEGKAQAVIADNLFKSVGGFKNSIYDKNHDGKLQIYLVKGEQGHQDTELRTKYSLLKLKELGYEIEILKSSVCDWDRNKAKTAFEIDSKDLIDKDGNYKVELLLSNNDDMALGCVDYLESLKTFDKEQTILEQYFPIIGVNGTDLGLKAIRDQKIYGTVKNNLDVQSDAIYKLGKKLINNESLENFEYKFDDERFIHTEGQIIVQKVDIHKE